MVLPIFLICFAASTIGGICGIGGGVIIKPLLDAFGILSVSAVSFLSGLTVLSMALVNVFKNRHSSELDPARSLPLGLGAALGGIAGKALFSALKTALSQDRLVGAVQAIVLGVMILLTLLYVLNRTRFHARDLRNPPATVLIGLILGLCSSFLGIGGGPMNLAVLYYFFSMPTKTAAVNSLLIILLSQTASLLVTLLQGSVPSFEWNILLTMVLAGILGGALSARLHKKLSTKTTDWLFIGLMCVILAICLMNAIRLMQNP